jgi:phospholipid/cholesterol/gamma-HCH transport system substrate-binding protein
MTTTERLAARLASPLGVFTTALVIVAVSGVLFLGSGVGDHTVTADFSDVNGLVSGNPVLIAGVDAGTVQSVQLVGNAASGTFYAQVTLSVESSDWPLHAGTSISVRPDGVLGNPYVEVDPGPQSNQSLGNSPSFGVGQTQSPINVDQLTNVFTPVVRAALKTQLQQGTVGFSGAGAANLNETLANTNPLTLDLISVTDVLATRSPQLDSLNFELDTITGDLASEDADLGPLITNLDTTVTAIAVREADLQGTLTNAANVFGDLTEALSSSTTQLDLARIFEEGPETLDCLGAFAGYITPIITAINPHISYDTPFTLDDLLDEFVTASGYNISTVGGVDSLRIDPIVPLGYTPHDTGGLTLNHGGYVNASSNGGPDNVYEDQPALTGAATHPVLGGCAPPAGLP